MNKERDAEQRAARRDDVRRLLTRCIYAGISQWGAMATGTYYEARGNDGGCRYCKMNTTAVEFASYYWHGNIELWRKQTGAVRMSKFSEKLTNGTMNHREDLFHSLGSGIYRLIDQ